MAHGPDATASHSTVLSEEWCRERFDPYSPDFSEEFHETLAGMRAECPVTHSDGYGGFWVVTKYEDVLRVAQDWATFSNAHSVIVPPAPIAVRNLPEEIDPPLHRVFKRLINPYFTPAAVAPWEPNARALVNRLIDSFIEQGECEFMADFARPYPALSFFDVGINAPAEDIERVAYMASKSSVPDDPEAAECWAGLSAWIDSFVDQRRAQPAKGDVVDGVLDAEIEGRPITRDEVIGTIQLLILGGLETTASALGHIVIRFCHEPEIAALLGEKPELMSSAVEELLRLDGPFIAIARTAMKDVEVGGKQIKAGDKVMIYWASANRDATEVEHPDVFDIERGANRHLAFGAGPHRCAGSNLARMNLRIALEEILRRMHDIRLQPGVRVTCRTSVTRAPLAVPITFTAGPRVH